MSLTDLIVAVSSPMTWCVCWNWPDRVRLERTHVPNAVLALRLAEAAAGWGCYCISIERCYGPSGVPETLLY